MASGWTTLYSGKTMSSGRRKIRMHAGRFGVYTMRIRQPNRKAWLTTERSHRHGNPLGWRQKMKRRDFFRKAGIGSATLASLPALAHALTIPDGADSSLKPGEQPASPFVILLQGTYKPVTRCPDLGLFQPNVCDGSYVTTKIYPVSGLTKEAEEATIGNFYVAPGMGLKPVAYDLPRGAMTMRFTANNLSPVPDGTGGTFLVGTLELSITEGTGIYQSFVGGHNKMVDILHRLADGTLVEHCFCIIRRP